MVADADDKVAADCETVERPAPVAPPVTAGRAASSPAPPSGPGEARRRRGRRHDEGPRRGEAPEGTEEGVQGAGPGCGRGRPSGATALRAGKVVGSGKAIAAPSGTATVKVKFTKAARKALKRAKSVTLTII